MNSITKKPSCQLLSELAKDDRLALTPVEASKVLGCHPDTIRKMAQTPEGRQGLGFPVIRLGADTKVLRIPFLRYLGWEGAINGAQEVVA